MTMAITMISRRSSNGITIQFSKKILMYSNDLALFPQYIPKVCIYLATISLLHFETAITE
jgi:hypothetical protein